MNRREACAALAAAALGAALYAGTLRAGFLTYDDPHFILEPEVVRAPSVHAAIETLTRPVWGSYHPLHILSYALDSALFGLEHPGAFHATNVLLYALTCALVVRVGRRFGMGERAALLGGLVFAAHPSHVESVAWATGRKDVLSGALTLAALLLALGPERRGRSTATGFGLFLLALASKTLAWALAPFLVLEALLAGRLDRREATRLAPFCILAVVWLAIELEAQKTLGTVHSLAHGSIGAQLRVAAWSLAWYPRHFLVPWPVTPRPLFALPGELGAGDALVAFELVAWALALAWLWRRRSRAALVLAWFALALLPVANFVPGPALVQDRYLFLPSVGAALLVGELVAGRIMGGGRLRTTLGGSLAILLLVAGSLVTVRSAATWRTDLALWQEAVRLEPTNDLARLGLAGALLAAHDLEGAAHEADLAHQMGGGVLARAFQAHIAVERGRADEARALAAEAWHDGTVADMGALLVRLELQRGALGSARDVVAELDSRAPASGWTALARAQVAHAQGDLDAAAASYTSAARSLGVPEAWLGLEQVERARGRLDAAGDALDGAARARASPFSLASERAWLGIARGDFVHAESFARESITLEPTSLVARRTLALALAGEGRLGEAAQTLETLVQQSPDADSFYDLARVRSRAGEIDLARKALEHAVALRGELRERAAKDPLLQGLAR